MISLEGRSIFTWAPITLEGAVLGRTSPFLDSGSPVFPTFTSVISVSFDSPCLRKLILVRGSYQLCLPPTQCTMLMTFQKIIHHRKSYKTRRIAGCRCQGTFSVSLTSTSSYILESLHSKRRRYGVPNEALYICPALGDSCLSCPWRTLACHLETCHPPSEGD